MLCSVSASGFSNDPQCKESSVCVCASPLCSSCFLLWPRAENRYGMQHSPLYCSVYIMMMMMMIMHFTLQLYHLVLLSNFYCLLNFPLPVVAISPLLHLLFISSLLISFSLLFSLSVSNFRPFYLYSLYSFLCSFSPCVFCSGAFVGLSILILSRQCRAAHSE